MLRRKKLPRQKKLLSRAKTLNRFKMLLLLKAKVQILRRTKSQQILRRRVKMSRTVRLNPKSLRTLQMVRQTPITKPPALKIHLSPLMKKVQMMTRQMHQPRTTKSQLRMETAKRLQPI